MQPTIVTSMQHMFPRLLHGTSSTCTRSLQPCMAVTAGPPGKQSALQSYEWGIEREVARASLDASQAQEASEGNIVGGLLQGRRHGDRQRDRAAGAPQRHHVAQVLVLEGQ